VPPAVAAGVETHEPLWPIDPIGQAFLLARTASLLPRARLAALVRPQTLAAGTGRRE